MPGPIGGAQEVGYAAFGDDNWANAKLFDQAASNRGPVAGSTYQPDRLGMLDRGG